MDREDSSWRVTAIYLAATQAVQVYDWIISLDREYNYIWRARPSFVSALYLIIRYFNIIRDSVSLYLANNNLTYEQCQPFARFQVYGSQFIYAPIAILFSLRAAAVWGNHRAVLSTLIACLCIILGVNFYAGTLFGPPGPFLQGSGPCFAGPRPGTSPITVVLWLNPFIFDTLMTLTLLTGIFVVKRKGGNARTGILPILVRDGVLYFVIISAVNLVNVGFYLGAGPSIRAINSGMAFTISSIVACRLILSLREHAAEDSSMMLGSGVERSLTGNTRVRAPRQVFGAHSVGVGRDAHQDRDHDGEIFEDKVFGGTARDSPYGPHVIALDKLGRKNGHNDDGGATHEHAADFGTVNSSSLGGLVPGIFITKSSHVNVDEEKV